MMEEAISMDKIYEMKEESVKGVHRQDEKIKGKGYECCDASKIIFSKCRKNDIMRQ